MRENFEYTFNLIYQYIIKIKIDSFISFKEHAMQWLSLLQARDVFKALHSVYFITFFLLMKSVCLFVFVVDNLNSK